MVASVGPAYLARLTRSREGRTGGPQPGGDGVRVATSLTIVLHFLRVTLSLKQHLMISLDHEVLGGVTTSGSSVETGRRGL